jgi:hypothetical protein
VKRAVLLLFLAACSVEQGKLPVVDEFTLPESATLDADGTYHVDATISFHDDDDSVRRVRVQIPAVGATRDYSSLSGKSVTKGVLPLQIVGTAPKGALQISVQAIDLEGNVSDPKSASVTLK